MKKKFTIIGIILATIVLAVVAVLTAIKLRDMGTRPVAPSAPESKPGATNPLPDSPAAACRLTFLITAAPTLTPTPTKEPGCDSVCQIKSECPSSLDCIDGHCRKTACASETNCTCPLTPTPTTTPIPACNNICTDNKVCPSGLECINGNCRNLSCITKTDCNCPNPVCDDSCTTNSECPSDLSCLDGHCRMTECDNETDCTCPPAIPNEPYCDYLSADPTSGSGPLTVQFAGKGYDPARVKGFRFTFGDGEKKEVTGSYTSSHVETINHTYTKNGIYKAVLEILDDGDHWRTRSECEQTITVSAGKVTNPTSTPKPAKVVRVAEEPTPTEVQLPVAGIKVPTLGGILAGFLLISLGIALVF